MITYGDIKVRAGKVAGGICGTDTRVIDYVNRAQAAILREVEGIDTTVRYRVTAENGYITWPRNILTIEAVSVDGTPYAIRNQWFEYDSLGDFDISDNYSGLLIDRGTGVTFSDIVTTGNPKRLKVTSDVTETAKKIILLGYDENGNWIRSATGGVYYDGEEVDISTTGNSTLNFFSSIVRIIKDETNANVNLYEVDSVTFTERLIGIYQWDETRPEYRRSQISGLTSSATVTVMAKLRSINVHGDNDFLIIPCEEAILDMVRALYLKDTNFPEYEKYKKEAVDSASKELRRWRGAGATSTLKFINKNAFAGNRNLI